jgi:signal transduction histidine kinase
MKDRMIRSRLTQGLQARLMWPYLFLTVGGFVVTLYSTVLLLERSFYPLTDKQLRVSGENLSYKTTLFFEEMHRDLQFTREQYDNVSVLRRGGEEAFATYANALGAKREHYVALVVTDSAGNILAANTKDSEGLPLGNRLRGQRVAATELTKLKVGYTGLVFFDEEDVALLAGIGGPHAKVMCLGTPLRREGNDTHVGYLLLYASLSPLDRFLAINYSRQSERLRSGALFVDSKTREVLLAPPYTGFRKGDMLDRASLDQSFRSDWMVLDVSWLGVNWAVVTLNDLEAIRRPVTWLVRRLGWVFFLSGLAAIGLTSIVTRRILLPINQLTYAVEQAETASLYRPVTVESGDEIQFLATILNKTFADISTYENQMQALVRERTAEIELRSEDLQEALLTLEGTQEELVQAQKHAALSPLVTGVAHELNTPLGVALTATSKLVEIADDFLDDLRSSTVTRSGLTKFVDRTSASSRMILDSLQKGGRLVADFKRLASLSEGPHYISFELKPLLELSTDVMQEKFASQNISTTISCDESLRLHGPSQMFVDVCEELVLNSILHAQREHQELKLWWKVESQEGMIRINYADNGVGYQNDILATALDPFVTSKRGAGHSGLGLTVVYNVITRVFGGRMTIANSDDPLSKGALCSVFLPDLDAGDEPAKAQKHRAS